MLRVRGAVLLNVTCTGDGSRTQQGRGQQPGKPPQPQTIWGHRERTVGSAIHDHRSSRYRPPTSTPQPTTHLAFDVGLGLLQRRLRRQLLLHQRRSSCVRLLGGAGHGAGSRAGDDTLGGQPLQTVVDETLQPDYLPVSR